MKHSQILIDIDSKSQSIALVEENRLNEFYVEYNPKARLTGNIYKGRVVNVLSGLQTAFVDIGLNKNAFLYVGETLDDRSDLRKSGVMPSKLDIKEGDYIMVQVTKEETDTKGARLSMNISLPGRHIVYLPTIDFVGISNKITTEEDRERLTKLLTKFKTPTEGFIARTICLDSKKSDILTEAKQMRQLYANIKKSFDAAKDVELIHSEENLLFRSIRDMLTKNTNAIICNDRDTVNRLKDHFTKQKSTFSGIVQYYESDYDMMDVFKIIPELDKLLQRKVELESGGYLVIDKTEALTAIDVNTGRYRGSIDHEETVFRTNMEAAKEIARQLRLRNIGGIIVIDFIDMMLDEHKNAVVELLRKEVLFDRIKTRVLDMTGLGLVEIARKKVGNELSSYLLDDCPICGVGKSAHSTTYLSRKMKVSLKRLFAENNFNGAIVSLNPVHVDAIIQNGYFTELCENEWHSKRIYLVPKENMDVSALNIVGSNTSYMNLPKGAKLLY